jgi:hypothetical protein
LAPTERRRLEDVVFDLPAMTGLLTAGVARETTGEEEPPPELRPEPPPPPPLMSPEPRIA